MPRVCRWCSKPPPKGRRYYCSDECATTYYENRVWVLAQGAALRGHPSCAAHSPDCLGRLEVHHITPLPKGQPYSQHSALHDQSNLWVLCRLHHEGAHKQLREEARLVLARGQFCPYRPPRGFQLTLFAERYKEPEELKEVKHAISAPTFHALA